MNFLVCDRYYWEFYKGINQGFCSRDERIGSC